MNRTDPEIVSITGFFIKDKSPISLSPRELSSGESYHLIQRARTELNGNPLCDSPSDDHLDRIILNERLSFQIRDVTYIDPLTGKWNVQPFRRYLSKYS